MKVWILVWCALNVCFLNKMSQITRLGERSYMCTFLNIRLKSREQHCATTEATVGVMYLSDSFQKWLLDLKHSFWSWIWLLAAFSLWSYLLLPSGHIRRLLCVERIGDAAHHKHIQLESLFLLLLLSLHLLQVLLLLVAAHRRAGAGGSAAAAPAAAGLEPSAAVAVGGSARGQTGSSEALRGRHLFVLHLQDLIPFLLAGRRVQHAKQR